jgi:hypothetical protein
MKYEKKDSLNMTYNSRITISKSKDETEGFIYRQKY